MEHPSGEKKEHKHDFLLMRSFPGNPGMGGGKWGAEEEYLEKVCTCSCSPQSVGNLLEV